jgi:hypothetical protein
LLFSNRLPIAKFCAIRDSPTRGLQGFDELFDGVAAFFALKKVPA